MQKASERDLSAMFAEWVYGEQPHRPRMKLTTRDIQKRLAANH